MTVKATTKPESQRNSYGAILRCPCSSPQCTDRLACVGSSHETDATSIAAAIASCLARQLSDLGTLSPEHVETIVPLPRGRPDELAFLKDHENRGLFVMLPDQLQDAQDRTPK
tara:strand:+ start:5279 stop:5617 length:339 start_codon:yes stop_codon:yes gene_type:complete